MNVEVWALCFVNFEVQFSWQGAGFCALICVLFHCVLSDLADSDPLHQSSTSVLL